MKKLIRKRTDMAECRLLVARMAEKNADDIRSNAYRARRSLNLDEQARIKDLKVIATAYRDEACRHILTATVCGNPVLVIRAR